MAAKLDSNIEKRKTEHLSVVLANDVRSGLSSGFETIRLTHEALPEIDLSEVDPSQVLFGKRLAVPILISSMTGGTLESGTINLRLAEAAQTHGLAMAVGSQRAGIENQDLAFSYQVRKAAPGILLFANLGAVQLRHGFDLDVCQRAVDMIGADGLILHLNPLQEALQVDGNTQFGELARQISQVCKKLEVPVIAKEVGWGISPRTARLLAECGVKAIDVAGAGGTSWSEVEYHRLDDPVMKDVARQFSHWGITTVDSIRNVKENAAGMMIFSSGGLETGIDVVKSICLGAKVGGMATPILKAATAGDDALHQRIAVIQKEILISMFAVGAPNLDMLTEEKLQK